MFMPGIFQRIDHAMKREFTGRRTEDLLPHLPPGKLAYGSRFVTSRPLRLRRLPHITFTLRGRVDAGVRFDNGEVGLVDFKTSGQSPQQLRHYARQLHTYALALERPAEGQPLSPVTRLGLLVYEPASFAFRQTNTAALTGAYTWIELPRDDCAFARFLTPLLAALAEPSQPPASASCAWCRYRRRSRDLALQGE
jgi:hypothetical protein